VARAPEGMWCPAWRTQGRGEFAIYEFGDAAIEGETEGRKNKACRVGSKLIHVPFYAVGMIVSRVMFA